jgi:adenylate kinase
LTARERGGYFAAFALSPENKNMRIVMLGAPGSGKGTQAQRLQTDFGLPHVSTGDLLRRAVADKTPIGVEAKALMDAGNLVPDAMVLGMIEQRIAQPDAANGFILDGYPRNSQQALDLEAALAAHGWKTECAVLMDVDFEILMKRLTGRRTCSQTGQVLNVYFSPPAELEACKRAGGELLQRADDNEATIANRLKVYEAQTAPLISHYRDLGLLVTVSATGEVDDVYARLVAALGLKR